MGRTALNITGQKYNRLTAISPTNERNTDGGIRWLFQCECGKQKVIRSASKVISGDIKSCGCLIKETSAITIKKASLKRTLPSGQAAFNALYQSYKKSAKKRNHSFNLTKLEFHKLINQDCGYCGQPPNQFYKITHQNGGIKYSGIDRVDNNLGYFLENCISACGKCNRSKWDCSKEEFLNWILKVYHYSIK